jgi:ATP-dependent helicase/nuclease subunit B
MPDVYRPLLELADQHQLVTVNERLARRLRAEYDLLQSRSGRLVWPRPQILSSDQWLAGLAEQWLPEQLFLSHVQEQALWERVIRDLLGRAERTLVQIPATARRAREAHGLLRQYAASFSAAAATPDQQVFLLWQAAYREQLTTSAYADRADLVRLLAAALPAAEQLISPLVLVGFDTIKPDLALLLETLRQRGSEINLWTPSPRQTRPQLYPASDPEDEVRQAARWARDEVAGGAERIGIVVPELHRYRSLFLSAFCAELDPQALLDPLHREAPFSISLGGSLADEGLIACALALLGLGRDWQLDDLSLLLRTPYLGQGEADEAWRAEFEVRLRSRRQLNWSRALLNKQFRGSETGGHAQSLRERFATLATWTRQRRKLPAGDWSQRFFELLQAVGWPGGRTLNSREYQAGEKFRALLQRFASLDALLGPLDRQEAVAQLQRLCQEETFQPEAPETRIEVVGLLEAGGLQFERLWVVGLHDGLLPGPLRPNPFLPLALQRRLQMPHADLAFETEYCRGLAERLFQSAEQVVVSYPQQEGDNPVRGHHLLEGWPERHGSLDASADPQQLLFAGQPLLTSYRDDQAPTLHSRKVTTGGTALLKDQALCPFRAFAHHRLRASAPESADVGLDAMMRGNLAHHLLEAFWRGCGDSATLTAMSGEALAANLAAAAETAITLFERAEKADLPPRQRQLELERLQQLGREWLALELERAPFRVLVEELEKPQVVGCGSLQIRTRIDRIDRLASGQLAVIDYKTGRPDPLQWLDARISEPQLPLYASQFTPEQLGAVLFGVVRRGDCRFRGLVDESELFPRLPERRLVQAQAAADCPSLAEVQQRWATALRALADQFSSGAAAVDPVNAQACRYCDLTPLCRIREAAPSRGGDDD